MLEVRLTLLEMLKRIGDSQAADLLKGVNMIIPIASLIYFAGVAATTVFVARATVARNATVVSALRTTPTETGCFALAVGALWPIYWPVEGFMRGARAIGKRAEAQQQEPVIIGEEENEPQ